MNHSLHVALISEHASPLAVLGGADAGGQNVHVAELACHLGSQGIEVTVYTRRDDPALPSTVLFAPNVEVVHVEAGPAEPIEKDHLYEHMAQFAAELERAWVVRPPDVAHSHFWMSGVATRIAARSVGVPWAHTFHALGSEKRVQQGISDTSPQARLAEERRIAREADLLICTSLEECHVLRTMGSAHNSTVRIPCGVDLKVFTPRGPAAPARNERHRIVVVSRLVPRKGIGNVVSALPALADVELIIAGGPPAGLLDDDEHARRLRDHAFDVGVADRVQFLGSLERDQVAALLRSADVVCCCPWYEPFGLVAVEAMACGAPVVATRVGGLAETVLDGLTGVHVPPRDPGAIASAVGSLLRAPAMRRRFSDHAVHRAQRFGWPSIAASTELQLRRLADQWPRRRPLAAEAM